MKKPKASIVISLIMITVAVIFVAYDTFAQKPSRKLSTNSEVTQVTYNTDVVEIKENVLPGIEIDKETLVLINYSKSIAINAMQTRKLQSQTELNIAQIALDNSVQESENGESNVTDTIAIVTPTSQSTVNQDLKDYEKNKDQLAVEPTFDVSIKSILIPSSGIATASVSFNKSRYMLVKEGFVFDETTIVKIEPNRIVTVKNGVESSYLFTN